MLLFCSTQPHRPSPRRLPKPERVRERKPNAAEQAAIIALRGRHCGFCGVPLIRFEVRSKFH